MASCVKPKPKPKKCAKKKPVKKAGCVKKKPKKPKCAKKKPKKPKCGKKPKPKPKCGKKPKPKPKCGKKKAKPKPKCKPKPKKCPKVIRPKRLCDVLKKPKPSRSHTPSTKFGCNWSGWVNCVRMTVPSAQDGNWSGRGKGRRGRRIKHIFRGKTKVPAFYEFSVQPKKGKKRYVCYSRSTRGFSSGSWFKYLLGTPNVTKELTRATRQGCKVFVRRRLVSDPRAMRKKQQRYDYPWNKTWYGKRRHQKLIRHGRSLSDESI